MALEDVYRNFANRDGHAFQAAVWSKIAELRTRSATVWRPKLFEFPVRVRGTDLHTDIVLENAESTDLMVIECKRANPKVADWCFAGPRLWPWPGNRDALQLEQLQRAPLRIPSSRGETWRGGTVPTYQTFVEVKRSWIPGDADGKERAGEQLKRAVDQVLRGVSGLVNHICVRDPRPAEPTQHQFFPVVVTTANLYSTPQHLDEARLSDGELAVPLDALREEKWLAVKVAMSHGLRHDHPPRPREVLAENCSTFRRDAVRSHDLAQFVDEFAEDSLRSVLVVRASALEEFITTSTLWAS